MACDYLTKVFQCVEPKIDAFGQKIKSELVVDIVITVPVVSYDLSTALLAVT